MSTLQTRTCIDNAHEVPLSGMGGGGAPLATTRTRMMPPSSTTRTYTIPLLRFRRTPLSWGLRIIFLTHPATIKIYLHIIHRQIQQHLKSTPSPSMTFWHIHVMSRVCRHVTLPFFCWDYAISQATQHHPAASHTKALQHRPDQTRLCSPTHPAKLAPWQGKPRLTMSRENTISYPTPAFHQSATSISCGSNILPQQILAVKKNTHPLSYHPLTNMMVLWS